MTNKEAIITLKANYPDACYEQLREAVDAAIKALGALEQLSNNSPKVDSNSGDLIRCKGCRYKKRKGVDYFCDHITGEEIMVSPKDYCSWAEKEERRDGQ